MLKVKVDNSNYLAMLKGCRDVIKDEHAKAMQRLGLAILADFIRSRFKGDPGVKNRTGFLKRGGFQQVIQADGRRELHVGIAGVKYARIQELSGTVTPKRSKWLTIPVGPALTPVGVARGPARSFPGLKFKGPFFGPKGIFALLVGGEKKSFSVAKSRDRSISVRIVDSKFSGLTTTKKTKVGAVYFILKKFVKLKARLGFFPMWRAWFQGGKARTFLLRTIAQSRQRLRGKATK